LPFRLALVTDAWHPQVNGVVNSLDRVVKMRTRSAARSP
jgi:hypothetical protein